MSNYPNVKIVGMHFRGEHAKEYAAALQPGDVLLYERETDNLYDANAVKILTPGGNGFHMGYINADDAAWIGPQIDEGMEFTVTVERLETYRQTIYPFVSVLEVRGEGNESHPQDEAGL